MIKRIYTIGHSTRPAEKFIEVLRNYDIALVADIRSIPKSRHNPQFNRNELESYLSGNGIRYMHLKELGGLRHTTAASVNTGWKNLSFRGFADHMQTPEFDRGMELLIEVSRRVETVIMCAEALPWRCHRSLVADALVVRSIPVDHIMSGTGTRRHTLTSFAKAAGTTITYPSPEGGQGLLGEQFSKK
jgi:uncharacterized protein (DUF488 family)